MAAINFIIQVICFQHLILTGVVQIIVRVYFIEASLQCAAPDTKDNWHFSGENIALNKPTNQTPNTYDPTGHPASFAVDGNCISDYYQGTCTHTNHNSDTSPTWTVYFETPYLVTELESRLANFKVMGMCDQQGNVTLYNDAEHKQFEKTTLLIELDGKYSCSSISIQIPQHVGYCKQAKCSYLTLCEVQVYADGCSRPSVPEFSSFSPNKTWYAIQETMTVNCNEGYKPSSNQTLTCCARDKFCDKIPHCEIVSCQVPAHPDNGFYSLLTNDVLMTAKYKSQIVGKCYPGYKSNIPNTTRQCMSDATWSGSDTVCYPVQCTQPENVTNGYYIHANNSYGGHYTSSIEAKNSGYLPYNTTITAVCNGGYSLNNIVTSRQCNEHGTWSNPPPTCIEVKKDSSDEASSLGMIAGVSTGAVIVLVAVSAAVIIIYRKRRADTKPNKEYNDIKPSNKQNEGEYAEIKETRFDQPGSRKKSLLSKKEVYENDRSESRASKPDCESTSNQDVSSQATSSHAYYSFQGKKCIPKSALKIENLSDIVLKGDTAAKNRFEKEFEKLPEGMIEEHKDARKAENIGKNRYKHLFAYDHSRVVLEKGHKEQTDYINACYVNGYSKSRAYIASQGPTKDILNDFWRMIWQTDCGKIVMLTNLVEENKSKCTQYWPDDGKVVYGEVSVTLQKSESFSEFVIRTFTLKKRDSKTEQVTQFHFTKWPDRGVPKYASSLVQFRNKVKYAPTPRVGPIVVHCSAGVGRTGTFIALDFLTDQAKDMGYVDVYGSVEAMRRQRVNLVQTLDQYRFLYHALVETLMLSSSATPSNKFPEWFKSMMQVDHRKKKRKLDIEFETLSRMSPSADECQYFTAKQIKNRKKNRYSNVLPVHDFMPQLEPMENTLGDSTYINAVFLPNYKENNAFIITQTPLEETKDDFWRLVWEYDIHVIVMMNNTHEASGAEQYWPNDSESIMSRNITIKHTKTEEIKNHKVVTLSLQKYMVSRYVMQVQCGGWQVNRNLPDSKCDILSLFEIVQSIQRKRGNQSVLVHCMNGADKSGLFCVLSAVIERMKIEQDVAITHVVKEMRNAREQIIPTLEQYEFCHEVVLAYIEDFSTYSNFSL